MLEKFFKPLRRKDPLVQLNEAGNRGKKIVKLWRKYGNSILYRLPIESNLDFCMEGINLYYARYAKALGSEETIGKISRFLEDSLRSHAPKIVFSFAISNYLLRNYVFQVACTQTFSDRSHEFKSIILIRSAEKEFKGCINVAINGRDHGTYDFK